jgi:hypothetical protein
MVPAAVGSRPNGTGGAGYPCSMASSNPSNPSSQGATTRFHEIAERAEITVDELLEFLDSPTGRRLRNAVAMGLIVSVPVIMRIPGLKRSPIGRLVEFTGGAAIVMKIAEVIRDWERSQEPTRRQRRAKVIDVPPVS